MEAHNQKLIQELEALQMTEQIVLEHGRQEWRVVPACHMNNRLERAARVKLGEGYQDVMSQEVV